MNFMYKTIIRYAYNRALEFSTWRNLVMLVGGSWAMKNPDQVALIVPICMSIVGLIGSFFPDTLGIKKETNDIELPKIELVSKSENGNNITTEPSIDILSDNSDELQSESKFEPKEVTRRNANENVFGSGFGDK